MSNVPALQRGLEILNYISNHTNVTLTQLETELEVPRASLIRMVNCLVDKNYLRTDSEKHFIIGHAMTCNATRALTKDPLIRATRQLLKKLSTTWNVTFVVYEYSSSYTVIWRCKEEPIGGIKTQPPGYHCKRMTCNAQGQLFLSYLDDSEIMTYAKQNCTHVTEYSITNPKDLLARIKQIRIQGYVYQERENNSAMKQIAIPLQINNTSTIALGCYLPISFTDCENLRDNMLLEAAAFIEQE